ncbi:hypothetical protein [Desulfolithobacter sp.]
MSRLCIVPLIFSLLLTLCPVAVTGEESEDLLAEGINGYILEISLAHSLVQIGDRSFRVEQVVVVDSDEGVEKQGSMNDLHIGDLVRIDEMDAIRDGSTWIARKIIVYRGSAQTKIGEQFKVALPVAVPGSDATQVHDTSSPGGTDRVRKGSDRIIFENGVWHN